MNAQKLYPEVYLQKIHVFIRDLPGECSGDILVDAISQKNVFPTCNLLIIASIPFMF